MNRTILLALLVSSRVVLAQNVTLPYNPDANQDSVIGTLRPVAAMLGAGTCTATIQPSTGPATISGTAFRSGVSGMPNERSEGGLTLRRPQADGENPPGCRGYGLKCISERSSFWRA